MTMAGKLNAGLGLWDEMKASGFRPNFGLYAMMIETQARCGRLDLAATLFADMEKAGFLPTPSNTESQNGECRVDCPDNDAEKRNVEIFSTYNGCIAIGVANNNSPLSSGSADVPTVTNAANSQVVSEPPGTTESPTEKNKTSEVADSDTSYPDAPEKPYVPPVIKISLEPEKPVIQQEIVDMYMKSMQQFTESLAKIETSENDENGSMQQDVFIMSSGDGDVYTAYV
ncbi:Pentatricopeptide repeat-containing protein [Dendrobium catenatum]|uniref:Pentatricopeptide repeat-containing protein n=1 Tax=Dendrobium catenatum TaxID=906689 RepID=A0A2I0XHC9_9ASPA|nr:Pentatricopeptide repeat-containing protein [Dendrobium catenatum]